MNKFVIGDCRKIQPPDDVSLMIADPVYATDHVNWVCSHANMLNIPAIVFMYPSDLIQLSIKPNQICHWIKPVSTKNTCKNYSNFVECIAMFGVSFYEKLHWSNRTGIFTDVLYENESHPWKKPPSLIERLIRNHYPGHGVIYDPCAGSGTIHDVCTRLQIPSFSVEINPIYNRN